MKKILILGVGAQGSTVAKRMDEENEVSEIICADYDKKAVDELVKLLKKGRGVQIDATNKDSIVAVAKDVDLLVNALPIKYGLTVMEAAIEAKTDYQDFAATDVLFPDDWVKCVDYLYDEIGPRFQEIGKTAIIGTGSAPGMICVVARDAMRYLDSCETVNCLVYEGVVAKRFLPFWWSPVTALGDMTDTAYTYENGKVIPTEPHSRPYYRTFKGVEGVCELVEHAHDEPLYIGHNADKYFKGAKNAAFKYGGEGIKFAKPLYRAGLLSREEEEINGRKVVPFETILAHIPPAPKYKAELEEILTEGLVSDTGAMVVEAFGKKDGKDVMVETYVYAPGMVESFERSGLSAEMYLTGQCGSFYTTMLVRDQFTQKGLISSDMLEYPQVNYYLNLAKNFDITLETEVKEVK